MPSVSWKQHRLMTAVEHDPAFAKKVGIPQRVGADFAQADDRAGITKHPDTGSARKHDEKLVKAEQHHKRVEAKLKALKLKAKQKSHSEVHMKKASGGPISPLSAILDAGGPYLGAHLSKSHSGMPMYFARAHARMPYIPIADTLRDVDKSVIHTRAKLTKLKAPSVKKESIKVPKPKAPRMKEPDPKVKKFAGGGNVFAAPTGAEMARMFDPETKRAVSSALRYVKGGDFGSAAAALHHARSIVRHPVLRRVADSFRRGQGLSAAVQDLHNFNQLMANGTVTGSEGQGE